VINGLKPYPGYKDSGVPWLGKVPAHWEVRRLKHAFRKIVGGSTPASTEQEYWGGTVVWVTPVDVSRTERLTTSLRRITREGLAACSLELVQPGSIVVTSRAPVGNVALAAVELCTNQGCKALVPDRAVVESRFAFSVMRILQAELESLATGTTFSEISTGKIGRVRIPLPPVSEQSLIIDFFEHVDRRIRRYIQAKKKLIRLLNEQKQIIIHRLVTRGLDPNVRLRATDAEWLKEVPEHWRVVRNGQLFVQRNQMGFGELPILEVSLKTGVRVRDFENSDRKQVMADRDKYKRAAKGDIAYNMMRMWQGAVGVAPVDGLVSPAYIVARPLDGVDPRYFSNLFRTTAYMNEVDKFSRGIVKDRNRLYWEDFKQIPSICPPPDEQVLIADAIDKGARSVDDGITRVQREMDLIQEYRRRLLADVVTGKLDVREAAARLPKESVDVEPLEDEEPPGEGEDAINVDLDTSAEAAEA
jgi:type I restriction enzyme S subunit